MIFNFITYRAKIYTKIFYIILPLLLTFLLSPAGYRSAKWDFLKILICLSVPAGFLYGKWLDYKLDNKSKVLSDKNNAISIFLNILVVLVSLFYIFIWIDSDSFWDLPG